MKVEIDVEGVPFGYEPVAFRVPIGEEPHLSNGEVTTRSCPHLGPRLIVRKVPPKLVPLEAKDVIVGKTIIRSTRSPDVEEALVLNKSPLGLTYCTLFYGSDGEVEIDKARFVSIGYVKMMEAGEYSNDHGTTWQPCSKAAP